VCKIFLLFFITLYFPFASHAKCISFVFGISSVEKNELASLDCKNKQVFYNSDIFINKKEKSYFVGESDLNKKIKFDRITKLLKAVIRASKKAGIKKLLSKHHAHLTVGKVSYKISPKAFKALTQVTNSLSKQSKTKNGVLIKKKKFYKIKNGINRGLVDALSLKSLGKTYHYNDLYWQM